MALNDAQEVVVRSRAEWRAWLAINHEQPGGIWLITYKKHLPDKHLAYNEAVEEALCFGWVDGQTRRLDDDRAMQYYAPRKAGSTWAATNKLRVKHLLAAGLMHPAGMAKIEAAKVDGSWTLLDDIDKLIVPEDLKVALAADPTAHANFESFPKSAKKGILWWIKSAKRAETRAKRIAETVRKAAVNERANQP
jgi:uncharacterized protein YdeI (YjbR/CyaY-like superfamily)